MSRRRIPLRSCSGGRPTESPGSPEDGFAAEALVEGYVVAFEDAGPRRERRRVSPWVHEATDGTATNFTAVSTHVTADGAAYNLCEGIRRARYRYGRNRSVSVDPGVPFSLDVALWNVHCELPAGDRLRLEVASSNHPRFDPHPGTTDPWQATADEVRTAEQTVFHEQDRESTLTVTRR